MLRPFSVNFKPTTSRPIWNKSENVAQKSTSSRPRDSEIVGNTLAFAMDFLSDLDLKGQNSLPLIHKVAGPPYLNDKPRLSNSVFKGQNRGKVEM